MVNNPDSKLLVLQHYRQCRSITATCAKFGISRQSLYNWIERYDAGGLKGLEDNSRAHRSHPLTTPQVVVDEILSLALRNPTLGGTAIAVLIKPPHNTLTAQTVNRILRKLKSGPMRYF